jgi:Fe-S-cluster containining protein
LFVAKAPFLLFEFKRCGLAPLCVFLDKHSR